MTFVAVVESGQTSLWLTVIGCSGQSSYYYLAFLLQGLIGFERERVLFRQNAKREDQERTFVIITPFIYSPLVFDFAGILVRITFDSDCSIFVIIPAIFSPLLSGLILLCPVGF